MDCHTESIGMDSSVINSVLPCTLCINATCVFCLTAVLNVRPPLKERIVHSWFHLKPIYCMAHIEYECVLKLKHGGL